MLIKSIKRNVKKLLQTNISTKVPPILVASMGRSGSTLVYNALCEAVTGYRFPSVLRSIGRRVVSDNSWDLHNQEFHNGVVYKTHALAHELNFNTDLKVVFLFGSASDAALSVLACKNKYGADWIKRHFEHLRADGTFEELGQKDVLRFGEQLDGWIGLKGTKRLILHYDSLWSDVDTLSEFIGVPVKLPPRRERQGSKSADDDTRKQFTQTYANLDARIASFPNCQLLD